MILPVRVKKQWLIIANDKAEEMGKLKNSITGGAGNIAGFVGELIIAAYLGGRVNNTYDYDIILPSGATIDVKTKRCTSEPKSNYDVSVAAFNVTQKCEFYAFVRVLEDLTKAWILGYYPKVDYFNDAKKWFKGQIDKSNGFRVKANCYNLSIDELKSINRFNVASPRGLKVLKS